MRDWQSLSHVRWDCKYHIVWVPKRRRKALYGKVRRRVGEIIRDLSKQRGYDIIEGHAMPIHIQRCISISPKYSVSNAIGFLKGKSTIRLHREFGSMATALLRGERVEKRGFGIFKGKHCDGYTGRNPRTGEFIKVKPKKSPFFRCGKELKKRADEIYLQNLM